VTLLERRRLKIRREEVDLLALAKEVAEQPIEATPGHPVRVEAEGEIRPVLIDPGRIGQVLTNLLSNAAKYGTPETEIRVTRAQGDEDAEVAVTNRGKGLRAPAPCPAPRSGLSPARRRAIDAAHFSTFPLL
jgi:signal transduction histidine kinase